MRKPLIALSLSVLASLGALALHPPAPAAARCRPAVGYTFARVGDGPVRSGGTLLLELRAVYSADQAVSLPETHVSVRRRGRPVPELIALRPLAANLFAFEVPTTAGHYMIAPASLEVDVAEAATVPSSVTAAPTLASPPLGDVRIGTGVTASTLEVTAPPATAIGEIVRWGTSSWYVGRSERRIGPGRCVPPIPGYDRAPASGDAMSVRHVDGGGGLGPETTFTAP